jgi:hypothetical protein
MLPVFSVISKVIMSKVVISKVIMSKVVISKVIMTIVIVSFGFTRFSALLSNIRPGWKGWPGTSTLGY